MAEVWRGFRRGRGAVAGLVIVLAFSAIAVLAPVLAPQDPRALVAQPFLTPTLAYPFGTDNLGRDVFSGVLYGAQVSLAVGLLAALSATLIGIVVGAVAGYAGGVVDALLMRLTELFQTLPRFFVALALIALIGPGLDRIIFVIGILGWPLMARLVRAQFLSLREQEFVEACHALGAPASTVVVKHILPNALPPAIVAMSLDVAQAILLEAGLSFFGLGDTNLTSWGSMLNNAQGFLRSAWWMAVYPGLAIFLTVIGFNLVGDGVNDALNPRVSAAGSKGGE